VPPPDDGILHFCRYLRYQHQLFWNRPAARAPGRFVTPPKRS